MEHFVRYFDIKQSVFFFQSNKITKRDNSPPASVSSFNKLAYGQWFRWQGWYKTSIDCYW